MTDMTEIPSASFIEQFKATTGAFSVAEAIALYNICLSSPQGQWIEFGSHKGKSSQAIALAMNDKNDWSELSLVEPEFNNDEWRNGVLKRVGGLLPKNSLHLVSKYSLDVLSENLKDMSFVFIDSGVHDDMVMEEVKMLENKMIPQGIIAFHDYKNQFTAVERAYNYLLSTSKYEVVHIDWPAILKYVTENNLEEGNNSWHQYPELGHPPNFVGAVRRK